MMWQSTELEFDRQPGRHPRTLRPEQRRPAARVRRHFSAPSNQPRRHVHRTPLLDKHEQLVEVGRKGLRQDKTAARIRQDVGNANRCQPRRECTRNRHLWPVDDGPWSRPLENGPGLRPRRQPELERRLRLDRHVGHIEHIQEVVHFDILFAQLNENPRILTEGHASGSGNRSRRRVATGFDAHQHHCDAATTWCLKQI
ncbi:MAG: hypothetical protein CL477_03145 [Acidobacteria bacterium]|nr:hypothetical protein [Acidobacteriota bacterium]